MKLKIWWNLILIERETLVTLLLVSWYDENFALDFITQIMLDSYVELYDYDKSVAADEIVEIDDSMKFDCDS